MVLLVDNNDYPVGTMPKTEAHLKGALHRAFSVFVFNSSGQMLLQRRAEDKYHSGGLWTNTCCSHPDADGNMEEQAARRTRHEMGIEPENMRCVGRLLYRSDLDNGMTENELDHILVGYSDVLPCPDPCEVSDYRYMSFKEIRDALRTHPDSFTVWFRMIMEEFGDVLETESKRRR